jgi:hypothetical protein
VLNTHAALVLSETLSRPSLTPHLTLMRATCCFGIGLAQAFGIPAGTSMHAAGRRAPSICRRPTA